MSKRSADKAARRRKRVAQRRPSDIGSLIEQSRAEHRAQYGSVVDQYGSESVEVPCPCGEPGCTAVMTYTAVGPEE